MGPDKSREGRIAAELVEGWPWLSEVVWGSPPAGTETIRGCLGLLLNPKREEKRMGSEQFDEADELIEFVGGNDSGALSVLGSAELALNEGAQGATEVMVLASGKKGRGRERPKGPERARKFRASV